MPATTDGLRASRSEAESACAAGSSCRLPTEIKAAAPSDSTELGEMCDDTQLFE